MTDLARFRCDACRADAPQLTEVEFESLRQQIPEWTLDKQLNVPQLW